MEGDAAIARSSSEDEKKATTAKKTAGSSSSLDTVMGPEDKKKGRFGVLKSGIFKMKRRAKNSELESSLDNVEDPSKGFPPVSRHVPLFEDIFLSKFCPLQVPLAGLRRFRVVAAEIAEEEVALKAGKKKKKRSLVRKLSLGKFRAPEQRHNPEGGDPDQSHSETKSTVTVVRLKSPQLNIRTVDKGQVSGERGFFFLTYWRSKNLYFVDVVKVVHMGRTYYIHITSFKNIVVARLWS